MTQLKYITFDEDALLSYIETKSYLKSDALMDFISKPDIQEALNKLDLDYAYDKIGNFGIHIEYITALLLIERIDPLEYLNDLPSGLFDQMIGITKIAIPSKFNCIPDYFCYDCKNLEEIILPDSITEIGKLTFSNCSHLKKVTLPKNLETIEIYTFSEAGIEDITIPDKVKILCDSCFFNCPNLKKVKLHSGLKEIGQNCFYNTALDEIEYSGTRDE